MKISSQLTYILTGHYAFEKMKNSYTTLNIYKRTRWWSCKLWL